VDLPVYSISKPFLAQAVLQLGFPLDAQIGEFVSNLAPTYAGRTIGALLNHTSGLDDYGQLPEYDVAVANREPAWSRAELLERCLSLPHQVQGFQYSNIGYLLLRMAVENATGLSYFESLQKLVFDPLEITGHQEWEHPTDAVPGYDPKWVYSGTFLEGEANVAESFGLLVEWRQATVGLEVGLVPVPYQNTSFDQPGYSFGFMNDGNPVRLIGHGGGGPGWGLMVLMNVSTGEVAFEAGIDEVWDQTQAITKLRGQLGA
jgi:D-alanyl-D-alanine carboxypeptidase